MRAQMASAVSGMAGVMSRVTIRKASRALPSTASTAGPGSAFHGSVASKCAFAAPMSRHVASSASCGAKRSHASEADLHASSAAGRSGLSASGAGPMPPHLEPTTVATRETRLPRLFARSEL